MEDDLQSVRYVQELCCQEKNSTIPANRACVGYLGRDLWSWTSRLLRLLISIALDTEAKFN